MDASPGFGLVVVEPPEMVLPGGLRHEIGACNYLVAALLTRSA